MTPIQILIIDDDERKQSEIKNTIKALTGNQKVKFHFAKSVSTASRKCTNTIYDLVILDVRLPISDEKEPIANGGFQFLKNIRNQRGLKRPRNLVGMTSYSENIDTLKSEFSKDCYTLIQYQASATDWIEQLSTVVSQALDLKSDVPLKLPQQKYEIIQVTFGIVTIAVVLLVILLKIPLTNTSRTLLFWMCGLYSGIFFGAKVSSKFSMRIPGFCISSAGATAFALSCMFLLHNLSLNSIPFGVYQFLNSNGAPTDLANNIINVKIDGNIQSAQVFPKGDRLLIIFPIDAESADISISTTNGESLFTGTVKHTPGIVQNINLDFPIQNK